jgi:hypothetical protein
MISKKVRIADQLLKVGNGVMGKNAHCEKNLVGFSTLKLECCTLFETDC